MPDKGETTSKNKGGRPTAKQTVSNEDICRQMWARGYSLNEAKHMAKRLKDIDLSVKTIHNYFTKFNNAVEKDKLKDYDKHEREVKNRIITAIGGMLEFLYKTKEDLEKKIKDDLEAPYFGFRISLAKAIQECLLLKLQVETAPTIDKKMDDFINDFITKNQKKFA